MFKSGLINDHGQDNWIFLAWMGNLANFRHQRQKCNHDTNTKDNINSHHAQQADTLARQSFNKIGIKKKAKSFFFFNKL